MAASAISCSGDLHDSELRRPRTLPLSTGMDDNLEIWARKCGSVVLQYSIEDHLEALGLGIRIGNTYDLLVS